MWREELTTLFSSSSSSSSSSFFYLPFVRILLGMGVEELRIKSKSVFIKGTLADNRDFLRLSTQSSSDRPVAPIVPFPLILSCIIFV